MDCFDMLRNTILFPRDEVEGMLTEYADTFDDPIKKNDFLNMLGREIFFLEMAKAITEMVILVSSATSVDDEGDFRSILAKVIEEKASDTAHMKGLRDFHVRHLDVVKKNSATYLTEEAHGKFSDRMDYIALNWVF